MKQGRLKTVMSLMIEASFGDDKTKAAAINAIQLGHWKHRGKGRGGFVHNHQPKKGKYPKAH